MTTAIWWLAGLAAAAVLVPCLAIQLRRCWGALVRRRQARLRGRGAVVGLAVARPAPPVPGQALV